MTGAEPPTYPELITAGAQSYYGVVLQFLGDDGDVVMLLGHHDDRRTVAVLNRCHRQIIDSPRGCGIDRSLGELCSEFDRTYARLITECVSVGHPHHHPDCQLCQQIRAETERDGGWWVQAPCDRDDPGAFPVTFWEVW